MQEEAGLNTACREYADSDTACSEYACRRRQVQTQRAVSMHAGGGRFRHSVQYACSVQDACRRRQVQTQRAVRRQVQTQRAVSSVQ